MKIEDLLFIPVNQTSSPGPKAGRDTFSEYLKEALAVRQQGDGPQALGGPTPVAGANQGGAVHAAQELMEVVLSRLELFQEALSRPGLTLKTLAPLVQALERDSRQLASVAKTLPPASPLRQLAEEAAALTWTEGCKFNRGDYV